MQGQFVKSAGTDVPVSRSSAELERVLRRYGATGFGVTNDYERRLVRVHFRVPDLPGDSFQVPIRLEVNIEAVAQALGFCRDRFGDPADPTAKRWEQAERVAWRHLVTWVDAACSASSVGLQRMSEAFLAHTLVRGEDGVPVRMVEQMDARAGGNWRGLLAPGGA